MKATLRDYRVAWVMGAVAFLLTEGEECISHPRVLSMAWLRALSRDYASGRSLHNFVMQGIL